MTTLTASEARIPTKLFSRVVNNGDRIHVKHRSAGGVVIVSEEDAALLEAIEDRVLAEAADVAEADMKAKGQKPIPWEKVKEKLGL